MTVFPFTSCALTFTLCGLCAAKKENLSQYEEVSPDQYAHCEHTDNKCPAGSHFGPNKWLSAGKLLSICSQHSLCATTQRQFTHCSTEVIATWTKVQTGADERTRSPLHMPQITHGIKQRGHVADRHLTLLILENTGMTTSLDFPSLKWLHATTTDIRDRKVCHVGHLDISEQAGKREASFLMELPLATSTKDLGVDKNELLVSPPTRGVVHHHPHIHPYLGSCQPHAIIPASFYKFTIMHSP